MAAPTIPNGEEYFFPVIYEGNGAGQRVGKFVPFTDNGTIDNSVIFNRADTAILDKTYGSAGTSRKKYTFSVWLKIADIGQNRRVIMVGPAGNDDGFRITNDNTIHIWQNGIVASRLYTNRTFEDTSKWYHCVMAVDTTQATDSNRIKFYVDGDLITSYSTEVYPSQDYEGNVGNNVEYTIGASNNNAEPYGGYMAEFNYVDGQALTPSTFGVTDTSTGRWIPKTLTGITYGTNGFRLKFQDSSALGDDTSGNGNDFSVTNLVAGDQTTDSPTQNFSTLEASSSGSMTLSEGNLRYTTASSSNWESVYNDKSISSGKWYFELTCKVTTAFDVQPGVILESVLAANKNQLMGYTDGSVGYNMDGSQNTLYYGNSASSYVAQPPTQVDAGDIVGVAYDADTGAMWFAKNNTWVNNGTGVGNPSTGANPTWVQGSFAGQKVRFGFSTYNASASSEVNFGQRSFTYTPPTSFVALQQDNLPETAKGISGLVWTKNRDAADSHQLYDSSRGKQLVISSDSTAVESTVTDGLQKFLAGGQQIEGNDAINTSGESFVSWNWVANGGTTSSNTDGSISSTVQANTTAGFSIVQYTGTGSAGTIGHGLSSAPEWIVIKELSSADSWNVWHGTFANTEKILLNSTGAKITGSTVWNSTSPTSSVISINGNNVNASSETYVAYCWHSVDGFSKFGSYSGNGSADGPFIYTGFKPAWLMIKETGNTNDWMIWDNARFPLNPTNNSLFANLTQGDNGSSIDLDVLSNGFKCRTTNSQINRSSGSYVYMAFAEHPFVGDGTSPVTAR
jgi:hypothetical protein